MRYPSDARVYPVYFTQTTTDRTATPVDRRLCCAGGYVLYFGVQFTGQWISSQIIGTVFL